MSRLYIVLLSIAAFSISLIGATFSVVGLAQLFSGAGKSVALMAAALEFAKIVSAGFLYRYWGHVNNLMRYYLSISVVALVAITSMGIFGYLSNAYQKSSLGLKTQLVKIESLEGENLRVVAEIKEVQQFIDSIPRNRITKKFAFQKEYAPYIRKLREKSDGISKEVQVMKLEILNTQTKIGPIIYVAKELGTDVDTVAKYLIFLFVSVFDPLAICLVFATSLAINLREKYRGNERRIAAHSLSNPVDHRLKKAS
ncbi:MAG: hypothetical protein SGI74_03325 [Oligoflexia bacterium]|nr:hypothetical protein [Oligoflexia bacterium]